MLVMLTKANNMFGNTNHIYKQLNIEIETYHKIIFIKIYQRYRILEY
jgi:hypothetical protein